MIKSKSCFVVVTGASRGFGSAVAVANDEAANAEKSRFELIARNEDGLQETKRRLHCKDVRIHQIDNDTAEEKDFKSVFADVNDFSTFDVAILVHNAGSLGAQGKRADDFRVAESLPTYFKANFFSAATLNAQFLHSAAKAPLKIIVNVSSLMAIQPMASWSQYCSVKAAGDMFFATLAAESDELKVLSYAPGPLDTQMVNEGVLKCDDTAEHVKELFVKMKRDGNILDPMTSAKKLFKILDDEDFKSGEHVDFYDRS